MTESPAQWFARVERAIESDGYRRLDWEKWPSWPFAGNLTPRALDAPADDEPLRRGAGGIDCHACAAAADPGADPWTLWWDDTAMLVLPEHGAAVPFAAFLMPLGHSDLAGLPDATAARMGLLLTAIERAVIDVLAVPRIQAMRWGDGGEHLHWWLLGRPTGALQLRGTFLSHWDDILPLAPAELTRGNGERVAARLVELVGGNTPTR